MDIYLLACDLIHFLGFQVPLFMRSHLLKLPWPHHHYSRDQALAWGDTLKLHVNHSGLSLTIPISQVWKKRLEELEDTPKVLQHLRVEVVVRILHATYSNLCGIQCPMKTRVNWYNYPSKIILCSA